VLRKSPPLHLLRRLATVPPAAQFTTAINLGELLYGAARKGDPRLVERVREREGRRLDEPDLRIASIALANELTLVTGNVGHFSRVPSLRVENWLVSP
jgi:predicted nucleic acid-binding protein